MQNLTLMSHKDNINKLLKPRNFDLYYGHLHIKYYYFYQQYQDHFGVVGLLSHK